MLEARLTPSLTVSFADPVSVSGSGSVDVESNAVANDASGNVYITGSFVGTANFAPTGAPVTITSQGSRDIFLAKYTSAGALVWVKDLPGLNSVSVAQGTAIDVDGSGSVSISGTFTGTTDFDPNGGSTSYTATLRNDAFVAKYDSNGNLTWAKDIGGPSGTTGNPGPYDEAFAITIDTAGNVYAAGSFQGTTTFGSTSLTAGGSFDDFVTKLNSAGSFVWTKSTTGSGSSVAQASGIAVDGSGNVVTTGLYSGTVDFNPGTTATNLTSAGSRDIFVQKLDSNGNFVWADGLGSPDIDQGNAVAIDSSGNIYLDGVYSDTVNFNPGTGTAVNLTATGYEDGFVLKLTSAGALGWARDLGVAANNFAQATGIGLDGSGHVYAAGFYDGTLSPVAGTATDNVTSAGGFDVFVVEYDTSGNFLTDQSDGGANTDYNFGASVNASGQIAISGRYSGPAAFGGVTLPAEPDTSVYLAQLTTGTISASLPAPTLNASDDSGTKGDNITNVTQPHFSGSGLANATANLLNAKGLTVASSTIAANGAYTVQVPSSLTAGTYTYSILETNSAGNTIGSSPSFTVVIDTTIPPAPSTPALLPASDSGTLGDGITNIAQPTLTGTGQANDAVQIVNTAGTVLGTSTVASGGTYSITLTNALANGTYALQAEVVEVAGNASPPSATFSLTIDTSPPITPTTPTLLATDDSGTVGDGITNVNKPHLTGTAEAKATIDLLNASNVVIGVATVASGGVYSVAPSSALADGTYVVHVVAIDAAGNTSAASGTFNVTIDTTPPVSPSTPTLLATDDSGTVGDGITNVNRPHFTGNATANLTLNLLNASNTVIGTATVSSMGAYTIQPTSALADGAYVLHTQAIDVAGNPSPASGTIAITIDTTAPATPGTPTLLATDDSGNVGDGITNVNRPHLTGAGEANDALSLLNASNSVVGTATVSSNGIYSVLPTSPLSDGTYVVHVQTTDAAGNTSASSGTFSLTIDTTAPAAPSTPALLGSDDSGTVGDGITNVNKPHLTGTSAANATVNLLNASNVVIGTTTASSGGSYSVVPLNPFADGAYVLHVQAIDAAGNAGAASGTFSLTIDTTPPSVPSVPTLLSSDDSGTVGDGITNINKPHFTGTALANGTLNLLNASNSVIGTATVSSSGSYSILPTTALADGAYVLHVQVIDIAGNLSASSGTIAITIDTTAPTAPTTPSLLASDDSGAVGDGITKVTKPHLTGGSEANATLNLLNTTNAVIGVATVASTGVYSVAPTNALADGTYLLHVQAVDAAGNVSVASGTFSLTIDTTAPATPSAPTLLATDDSGTAGDGITNVNRPHFGGTAEANSTLDLLNASNTLIGVASVSSGGSYSIQPTAALADGTYILHVQAIDAAGNASAFSGTISITIDTAAPAAPNSPTLLTTDDSGSVGDGLTNVNKPHLIGTAPANTTLDLLNSANSVIGVATVSSGGAYSVVPTSKLADGTYLLHVQAIDVAGNTSAASGTFSLTIDTSLPGTPSAPTLLPTDDTGTQGDGITTITQPHLIGTAEANDTIDLLNSANAVIGVATVASNGSYSVVPTSPLSLGSYLLTVQSIDAAGNASAVSGGFSLTIASTSPNGPSTPTLRASDDSGLVGDGITNVTQPHLIGTALAGQTLNLLNNAGTVLGTTTVSSSGTYSVSPATPLGDGSYVLFVETVDSTGAVIASSGAFALTIDTTPPAMPSAPTLLPVDDSGAVGDGITNVTTPRLVGTTEANATIELFNASNQLLGVATASATGGYSVMPTTAMADGTYVVDVVAVDAAGNVGPASGSFSLTIDTTLPPAAAAPTLSPSNDIGVTADRTTSRTPTFFGTATPGDLVSLVDGSGTVLATTTAAAGTGNYSFQITQALSPGVAVLQVTVTDAAGNISLASPSLSVTIADTPNGDFDGDGTSDLGTFTPATAAWSVPSSSGSGTYTKVFGATNLADIPVPGDYDGLGKDEVAIYRPATAQWYISGPNGTRVIRFGEAGVDIPVPGDYDNVGYTEIAVFRPTTAQWFVLGPHGSHLLRAFGATNMMDVPVPGDYDGVGYTEMAVFRPSTAQWFVYGPNGSHLLRAFGATNLSDIPVPGDYDGVGHTEIAIYRPSTGQLYVNGPSGTHVINPGISGLVSIPLEAPTGSLTVIGLVPVAPPNFGFSAVHPKINPAPALPIATSASTDGATTTSLNTTTQTTTSTMLAIATSGEPTATTVVTPVATSSHILHAHKTKPRHNTKHATPHKPVDRQRLVAVALEHLNAETRRAARNRLPRP